MAAKGLVVVTGFRELDAKLRNMPAALQKKFIRGGLRKGGKRDQKEAKKIIHEEAHETGALEKSVKIKSLKRSRTRVGVGVYIDRDAYFKNYESEYGTQPHPAKGEKTPFYVPAVIEFGDAHKKPIRPLRRALYGNEKQTRADFVDDVTQFIADNKISYKL